MAILVANDGDKIVNTIADRDAITSPFPGMQVTVVDAIADIQVGTGTATYQWVPQLNRWRLIAKDSKDDMQFIIEDLTITDGAATLTYAPQSNVVLSALVYSSDTVLADVRNPGINNKTIDLGTQIYNGLTLSVAYAYGTITAAIAGLVNEWKVVNANYQAVAKDRLFVDTSAGQFTITLPANPVLGNEVKIADYSSIFETTPVLINGGTKKVVGSTDVLAINVTNKSIIFTFSGEAKGWIFGA